MGRSEAKATNQQALNTSTQFNQAAQGTAAKIDPLLADYTTKRFAYHDANLFLLVRRKHVEQTVKGA